MAIRIIFYNEMLRTWQPTKDLSIYKYHYAAWVQKYRNLDPNYFLFDQGKVLDIKN